MTQQKTSPIRLSRHQPWRWRSPGGRGAGRPPRFARASPLAFTLVCSPGPLHTMHFPASCVRCASTFCASTLLGSVGSLSMWSARRPRAPRLGAHRAVWLGATFRPAAARVKRARVCRCASLSCASPVCASPFLVSVGSLPMLSALRPLAPRLGASDVALVSIRRAALLPPTLLCPAALTIC